MLDRGNIIIRTNEGSVISAATDRRYGTVVVYEADDIDPVTRTGWSVMVTGLAHLIDDPGEAARYWHALRPWVAGQLDYVIRIDPQIVTGFELTAEPSSAIAV